MTLEFFLSAAYRDRTLMRAFTPGTAVPLAGTGLSVTLSGSEFVRDDHWIIAARPETPDQVVPWSLEVGRGVHAVRRFFTPAGRASSSPSSTRGSTRIGCFPTRKRVRSASRR